MRKLTLLFLLIAGSALAQDEILEINNWRMHEGDDPAWARPDYDDSRWEASPAPSSRTGGIAKAYAEGKTWYRATIAIPPGLAGRDLAIGMPMLDEVYTLYFDGVPVGQFGHWDRSRRDRSRVTSRFGFRRLLRIKPPRAVRPRTLQSGAGWAAPRPTI